MRNSSRLIRRAAVLCAACLSVPVLAAAQGPPVSETDRAKTEAEVRARAIERNTRENARQLTLFDKQGKVVSTVGDRSLYNQPVLSPDVTRVAVIKADLAKETNDLWVVDLGTGRGTQITTSKAREPVQAPAWSPDGTQLAFVGLRGSRFGIYRKPATGDGEEELIYQHAGGPIVLTDWSLDGRMLSFYASDLSGSTLYLVPLDGDRKPIEVTHSESQVVAARLSPDARWLAYRSNEKDNRDQIFVRAVPAAGTPKDAPVGKWQISTEGGEGMVWWRRDGKELYYFGPQRGVMAVDVRAGQDFEFSKPRRLFTAPASIPATGNPGAFGSVSRDGERVVFVVPPSQPMRQLTVFDRAGTVVRRVGEPGLYVQPSFSPDGSKVAVMRVDPQSDTSDIWTYDVSSGKGTAVTSSREGENAPVWLPDGKHVAYVSMRGNYAGIYRKASTGQGAEEQLFRYTPGAGMVLTDFSADGKFLAFDGGGIVLVVPLAGDDPLKRQGVDFARSEFEAGLGRFSPDGRFVAYGSNETGRFEVFVRPFDAASASAAGEQKWKVSGDGAIGGITWSKDGRELYYLNDDRATSEIKVMAVAVKAAPTFEAEAPRELFRLKGPLPGNAGQWKISADGQRFVFAVPVESPSTK
jgi:Tol biopolymer transport system component